MAWVIFLAPADLGEAVLASGALAHVLRETDDLTLIADTEINALLRAAPAAKLCFPSEHPIAFAALAHLQRVRCDVLIDARGDFAARMIPAKARVRLRPSPMLRHLTEAWSAALGADHSLPPVLWVDDDARRAAAAIAPDAPPLLLLAPGGNNEAKRWPHERFAAVARRLVSGPLAGARIVVLGAAARDGEIAARIVSSLDADGVPAAGLGEAFDLLAAAALAERATLCIGNDNALTHIAAAVGAPTLTLFGPTDERVRAPFGARARTLRGRSFEDIAAAPALDARTAMDDISIDAVEAAVLELLHAGGLR
ncbi:MAG: glycosyltransferase family 9 protein [Caulobacteraceae bacterium]